MEKQAVLFDLDGTLLDTLEDLAACLNAVLEQFGLPPHPLEAHKYMIGDGLRTYVVRALPEDRRNDEALIERVIQADRELYGANWAAKTHLYDGVPELLSTLADRGLKLAVLSNKPDGFTRLMVSHFMGDVPFQQVRGARDGTPLKPDPAAAVEIADALGAAPENFLYVGDTSTDMRTAVGAGMFAVGALWGFRTRDELEASGANVMIHQPLQVLDLL